MTRKYRRTHRVTAFSVYSSCPPLSRTMLTAVQRSTAPNRKKIHTNWAISAAPTAMNAPRMTSASTMPISRTRCWWIAGTRKDAMITMKMNRLSTDSEYSVM